MLRTLYAHWSDEVARNATITLVPGTSPDTYGVTLLTDDDPAHVFKANETTVGIQFAYGAKQPVELLTLIHGTLEADDDVRLLGDDAADWGSPAFDVVITPAGWVGSGSSRWPLNTYVDLRQSAGFDPAGFENYLLTCGRDTALAQALQLGQVGLYRTVREMFVDRGFQDSRTKPRIENRTGFDIATIYSRGTTIWRAQLGLGALFDVDDERAAIEALWSDADGANHPWPIVPDDTDPRCYLVRFVGTSEQFTRLVQGVSTRAIAIEELGRGLRPGV